MYIHTHIQLHIHIYTYISITAFGRCCTTPLMKHLCASFSNSACTPLSNCSHISANIIYIYVYIYIYIYIKYIKKMQVCKSVHVCARTCQHTNQHLLCVSWANSLCAPLFFSPRLAGGDA